MVKTSSGRSWIDTLLVSSARLFVGALLTVRYWHGRLSKLKWSQLLTEAKQGVRKSTSIGVSNVKGWTNAVLHTSTTSKVLLTEEAGLPRGILTVTGCSSPQKSFSFFAKSRAITKRPKKRTRKGVKTRKRRRSK